MGMLGKILVLFHTLLSLGMLTWAIGVNTQKIKWKSATKEDPGVFERQKAKVDDLTVAMDRAYYRWTSNITNVRRYEKERYPRRQFYLAEMSQVETGKNTEGKVIDPPILELVEDPRNGFLSIVPGGRRPIMSPAGMPLKSLVGYEADMVRSFGDIKASQDENKKALDDRAVLNNEIIGVTKPALIKGLRQQINEQKVIEDEANLEITYVGGFTTVRESEFGLLKKRKDALTYRMEELKKFLEAKGKVATGD